MELAPEHGSLEKALDVAYGAQDDTERVAMTVETLLARTTRLEKALSLLLNDHPRGARTTLDLGLSAFVQLTLPTRGRARHTGEPGISAHSSERAA